MLRKIITGVVFFSIVYVVASSIHPLESMGTQDAVVYTASCGDFSIPLVVQYEYNNILVGPNLSYEFLYEQGGVSKVLYTQEFLWDDSVSSLGQSNEKYIFKNPTALSTEGENAPLLINIVLSYKDFTDADFQSIANCLSGNEQTFDGYLLNLTSQAAFISLDEKTYTASDLLWAEIDKSYQPGVFANEYEPYRLGGIAIQ